MPCHGKIPDVTLPIMSSDSFQSRFRSLVVIFSAVGMICSGFLLPLHANAETAARTVVSAPPVPNCCYALGGNCEVGCCAMQAPAVSGVPASRSNERPPILSVPCSQAELLRSKPGSVAHAQHLLRAPDRLVETSLQSLQVRLDV